MVMKMLIFTASKFVNYFFDVFFFQLAINQNMFDCLYISCDIGEKLDTKRDSSIFVIHFVKQNTLELVSDKAHLPVLNNIRLARNRKTELQYVRMEQPPKTASEFHCIAVSALFLQRTPPRPCGTTCTIQSQIIHGQTPLETDNSYETNIKCTPGSADTK